MNTSNKFCELHKSEFDDDGYYILTTDDIYGNTGNTDNNN